nr:hypothetical protein OH820_07940 [Streptomyces sp. NBC_00857]
MRPRGVVGGVRGLLRFDSDLVHALDAEGPEVQRAVALLAARRACEAAGLIDVSWVTQAFTALEERRPLPPPFDDTARLWETLRSDPKVPTRSVLEAIPPERPPYRPPTPPPAAGWTWVPAAESRDNGHGRRGLGRALGAFVPTVPADERATAIGVVGHGATVVVQATANPRGPVRISQPHFALPAVLAAAEPDPLKAAMDAVCHAVNTYGEHHQELLEEIRSACAERVWA